MPSSAINPAERQPKEIPMNEVAKVAKVLAALALGAAVLAGGRTLAGESAPPPKATEPKPLSTPKDKKAAKAGPARTIELSVTEKGFEPSPVTLKKGEPVK